MPNDRKAYYKAYYLANREKHIAAVNKYNKEHPEVPRAHKKRYRKKYRVELKIKKVMKWPMWKVRQALGQSSSLGKQREPMNNASTAVS